MARRVNTKFVVIMSVSLGAMGMAGAGWLVYHKLRAQNPEVARAAAEEQEKDGLAKLAGNRMEDGIEALKLAESNYYRAAALSSVKHISGADELFAHAGELCTKISKIALTQEDAVRYYQLSEDCDNRVFAENPRNKAFNEAMLEKKHQLATDLPSIAAYSAMEEMCSKLIKTQDEAKPRLYRAESRLRKAQGLQTPVPAQTIDDILADLDKAQEFSPKSGQALALRAETLWLRAAQTANTNHQTMERFLGKAPEGVLKPEEMAAMKKNIADYFVEALEPLRAHAQANGIDTQVSMTMASLLLIEYQLLLEPDQAKPESVEAKANAARLNEAIDLLEKAFAADPTKAYVADRLGDLYTKTGHPEKAEELYKSMIARTPEDPHGYFRLATFYQSQGELLKLIAAYKDVVKHPRIGSGIEAILNAYYQRESVDGVVWYNLELADQENITAEQKAACLKEAGEYLEKLRTSHAPKGMVDLLDGRTQLINRDYAQAVVTLRRAEASLNGSQEMAERLWRTEMMLAEANILQGQAGLALELVEKALEMKPNDSGSILQKGQLLLQLARYDEAAIYMQRFLGDKTKEAGIYTREKSLLPAFAERAKAIARRAEFAKSGLNPEALGTATTTKEVLLLAQSELNTGDFEAALKGALSVLEKVGSNSDPENIMAYQIAVVCDAQLKQFDAAKKLAAEALAKFPKNAGFQTLKAQLDQPVGVVTPETAKAVFDAISDEYLRLSAYASYYQEQNQWDEEIKVLQKAEASLINASTPEDREKLSQLQERIFTAALAAAQNLTDLAKKDEYFKIAQAYVTAAEKLNFDGTDGKLYRGRLELVRSNGKAGLQYLQQAVAQRPEYAYARMVLGRMYFSLARQNEAFARTSTDPADASSHINMAAAQRNSALEELRQVIRLAPNNVPALQDCIELLVRRGDASSIKEAQDFLKSGLQFAPYDSKFIRYSEFLLADVDQAIKSREEVLAKTPDDRDNRNRLAILYSRKKDKESDPQKKQAAIDRAIELISAEYQKNKDDLPTATLLANLKVQYFATEEGAAASVAEALKIFDPFLAKSDPEQKFVALLSKAEFLRGLNISGSTIGALVKAGLFSQKTLWEESAATLNEAIKIEPKDSDQAERHLADMYFDMGKMPEAEKAYLDIIKMQRNVQSLDAVTRRLIEVQLRQDKYNDVESRLAELLKRNPKDIQALTLRAYASIQQKKLQPALADLNQVLAIDEGNTQALYYRALAQVQLGDDLGKAEQDLQQVAKLDPRSINGRMLLAEILEQKQQYEAAIVQYTELLTMFPEQLPVRIAYADYLKRLGELQLSFPADSDAEVVVSIRQLDPLEKLLDQAKEGNKLYGDQARWIFLYGHVVSLKGSGERDDSRRKSYELDAQRIYEQIFNLAFEKPEFFKLGPSIPEVCDAYFGSLLKTHDYDKVVQLSTTIIDNNKATVQGNPEYSVLFIKRAIANEKLKKTELAAGDVDLAMDIAAAAAAKNADQGIFVSMLGQMAGTGMDENALSSELLGQRLKARVDKNPGDTISRVGLMQTLLLMKKPQDALLVANSTTLPAAETGLRGFVLREIALVRYQARQYDAAERDFRELLDKVSPNDVDSLNNFAYMLADALHRPKDAIPFAERALKLLNSRTSMSQLSSSAANVLDTLGWAKFLSGDTDGAIGNLQTSLKSQPTVSGYLHLGLAYEKSKNTFEALHVCDEGIKLEKIKQDDMMPEFVALQDRLNRKP